MRPQSAPVIRLKNYAPSDYTIETVDLTFRLDPKATRVCSVLSIKRQKAAKAGAPLKLDGDELKLVSIKIDGQAISEEQYDVTNDELILKAPPKSKTFVLEIETEIAPAENTSLTGLYQSSGVFCTQCEAEGFRRITYFLDRPDVLAVYTVRIEADKSACPILLSNGNPVKKGKLANNRHFAVWHDPHPKPSYLFALVGGTLDVHSDGITTMSGKKVKLNIYVEPGKADMAKYAMDALKRSMVWDEEQYGREYDLDIFNIVAVSDFNMGAMENKGLNVFNDKYVLADPDLATDADYMAIEAIIAHEYFHNWTGNRITCRDWFQLCLKEGLTVYRDHEFSADQRSRPVQRIMQVRTLKAAQFPEDAGPLAHSVRPDSYKEINNFYTATVYKKGSELVRMLAIMVGAKAYRKSTDLYFKRHDGQAAVVEDWLKSFEDAAKIDLTQFMKWYGQAGTPVVTVSENFDKAKRQFTLTLAQSTPPTPGQKRKQIVPIPIQFGLMDKNGNELPVKTKNKAVIGDVILLDRKEISVKFEDVDAKPIPSLLRGFSAPINLDHKESKSAKLVRARYDQDLYNRWEALNSYTIDTLKKLSRQKGTIKASDIDQQLVDVLATSAFNEDLEPEFRAQIMNLPSENDIAREIGRNVDPDAISNAISKFNLAIGNRLGSDGLKLVKKLRTTEQEANEAEAVGLRSLTNRVLPYLVKAKIPGALALATKQFNKATNMTDRLAALDILLYEQKDTKLADRALNKLFKTYENNPLVVDKWFSIQALHPGKAGLTRVSQLVKHPKFSIENPNRARSLLAVFAANNPSGFHRADGKSYKFYAKSLLAIDKINPQLAARLLTLMNNWKMFEKQRRSEAKSALQTIANHPNISQDLKEIVDRTLK